MPPPFLSDIETPAVLVDEGRLAANIDRMQALADGRGLRLRPHAKTHKSVRIGRMQLAAGAAGLTVAKPSEAAVFMAAGIPSVTVAYPLVDPGKIRRLLATASTFGTDLRLIVDSAEGLGRLEAAVDGAAVRPGVYVKIDVGLHRCGLREGDHRIVDLVAAIHRDPRMGFRGLLSHAGHAYGAAAREAVAEIAESERRSMVRVREAVERAVCAVPEVSVGATPTVLAAEDFEGITEIRPGNYVFLDRTPLRLALAALDSVALTVVATVVSRNPEFLVIDAGSKTLSSDQGAHGAPGAAGFGWGQPLEAFGGPARGFTVARLSEEHGFVHRSEADLPVGAKVRVVPSHACPVANLAGTFWVIRDRGIEAWPVDAAGKVR